MSNTIEQQQQQIKDNNEDDRVLPANHQQTTPSSLDHPPPPPPPPPPQQQEQNPPTSSSLSYLFTYLTFLLLGIGQLLPWNAFISAESYFQSRFCNDDSENFELWFGLIFHVTGIVPLGIMLLWEWRRQKESDNDKEDDGEVVVSDMEVPLLPSSLSSEEAARENVNNTIVANNQEEEEEKTKVTLPNNLILPPLLFSLLSLLLTTLLTLLTTTSSFIFTTLTYLSIAVTGITCSILGVGNLALSRIYPTSIGISPLMNGLALGGFGLSIVNFVSGAWNGEVEVHVFWEENCVVPLDQNGRMMVVVEENSCSGYTIDWGAFTYFGVGSLVLILCVFFYVVLRKLPLTVYFREMAQRDCTSSSRRENNESAELIDEQEQRREHGGSDIDSEDNTLWMNEMVPMTQQSIPHNKEQQQQQNNTNENVIHNPNLQTNTLSNIWKTIKHPTLAIFFSLFVIFTLFPAWTSRLESVHKCKHSHDNNNFYNRLSNDLFIPMTIIVFNTCDLIGRILAGKVPLEKIQNVSQKIFCASLCMFIYLPLFMLCNTSSSSSNTTHSSRFTIQSDVYTILLMASMAFANGFIITCAFSHGPRLLPPDGRVQELASTVMNFVLALSALLGSLVSFLYVWIAAL